MVRRERFGPTLRKRLRRLGVALVYLYGSQALERATRLSDVDVGIVLRDPRLLTRRRRVLLHSKLLQFLEPLLIPQKSQEIDLVFLQTASAVLQFEAINAGCPLFIADPVFKADYEESVIRQYLDIRPLVEVHYQAVLDRAA